MWGGAGTTARVLDLYELSFLNKIVPNHPKKIYLKTTKHNV